MKMLTVSALIVLTLSLGACVHSAIYASRAEAAYPASGRSINISGANMHVLEQGENGPVVLMIHGASANAREFEWTLAPKLSEDHRVLMADRPGHGHSGRPDGAETLEVQAALMADILKALAPDEKAIVVGHSFGGAVALRLALDHPDLVDSLVLLAPVSHDWGGGGEAWYNSYAAHGLIGPIFTQLVPIIGPAQVKTGIVGVFSPKPAPENYYEKSGVGLLFRPKNFQANAKDVNALQDELAAQQSRYGELEMPIVVFSGAQDTVIKPQLHVGRLKYQAEDLTLVALDDGGHMPHHAFGEDVAEVIRELAAD